MLKLMLARQSLFCKQYAIYLLNHLKTFIVALECVLRVTCM
jgi:hypothetical protein